MPDLARQTPKQRAHYAYMMDVMRRLEWDLHHTIEATGRIPEAWHEIATAPPRFAKRQVNLGLDEDVVKFFRSMGPGYGGRINDVLKSYMHARLAGVIRGAETINHFKTREEVHAGPKPAFGDMARMMGKPWEDAPGEETRETRMQRMREKMAAREG